MNIENLKKLDFKELKKVRSSFYEKIKGRPADSIELKFLGKLKSEISKKKPFSKK